MAGWFTITSQNDVDIYIDDIIKNLNSFNSAELSKLYNELSKKIFNKSHLTEESIGVLEIKTLSDEYKFKILKELFNRYNLEDIEKVLKLLDSEKRC